MQERNMKKPFKALIIDDERLARKDLISLLRIHDNVTVVGEADDVPSASQAIEKLNPDVIFLDIQMPGDSGFDLLEKTDVDAHIIFVTAYDEYAIRAFEVNALDYLLKPVNPDRLAKGSNRSIPTAWRRLSRSWSSRSRICPQGFENSIMMIDCF
jgi:two-component system LytT family response regulator